ncbi:MAG: hypothetical protein WC178_05295 [Candidatus Paceibacterota bacterium]
MMVVNKNNSKIILAAIIVIAAILIVAMLNNGTSPKINVPVETTSEVENIASNDIAPSLLKKNEARELLEKNMEALFAEEYLVENTNLAKLYARYRENELYWNTDFELTPSGYGGMEFGFKDGTPENAFYGGPVILWYKTTPESEIEYSGVKVMTGPSARTTIVDVIPVEWGFEYYETPPPQVLKIMSDNDIKLHY